ncbi:MAG: TrkH family potassium uptake protein, partial [Bacteroidota bacterium]
MINGKAVVNVVGVLLVLLAGFMLTPLLFTAYFGANDGFALGLSALCTGTFGAFLWAFTRGASKQVGKREGYLIVALGWLFVALCSGLPYWFSGALPTYTDAFFESVSGLTTTGASVINDIEGLPQGVLFWRSLTQWIGGMGIIVLTVALFPLLGIGGVELFVAEAPGPTSDKVHPRIKETAKRLWLIYVGLTVTLTFLLLAWGMTGYDAINHALTTMATGGFSTKNASIAYFDAPAIQYTITFFMFLAGINYTITYYALKGDFKRVWQSDEFKTYLLLIVVLAVIFTTTVYQITDLSFEQSFRDSIFQILALVTTTGFVSADYTAWTPALTVICFCLLFVGACAGSTS